MDGHTPLPVSGCRDLSHHPWISDALLGHWATTGLPLGLPSQARACLGRPLVITGPSGTRYLNTLLGGGSIIGEGAGAGLNDDADDDDGGVRGGTRRSERASG